MRQVMWAANNVDDVARIGVEGFETEASQTGDEWQREFQAQFPYASVAGLELCLETLDPRWASGKLNTAHGYLGLSVSRLAWRPCKCMYRAANQNSNPVRSCVTPSVARRAV
jgi:hypothetical protein